MSRFRWSRAALGLVFLGVCACDGSSEEHGRGARGGAGGSDSGAAGDAGGANQGGTAPAGGTAPTGGAGSSSGGSGAMGGDGARGGDGASSGAIGGAGAGAGGAGGRGGNGGSSGAGGSGGAGVTYSACQFGSGIARTVIAKRDPARDRCVVLILNQPGSNTLGLTLPMSWGVEAAFFATPAAANCLIRFAPSGGASAESGTGSVMRTTGFVIDVDVTLTFPGSVMEDLEATGLDASPGCPL